MLVPGEVFVDGPDLPLNAGRRALTLVVENRGDRPIQVGSHYHFAETNAALAFDRAGRDLAAALQGGLVLHRFEPQLQQRSFDWPAACLTTAFSPNGRVIVTGTQDGSVHFWYLASGKDSQMRGYPAKVADTVWTHDSRYLATIAGEALVVWDFGGKSAEICPIL